MSGPAVDSLLQVIASSVELDSAIDEDTPLISSGMIDSFDIVGLVTAMEERFGVRIPVEDISVETFDTPRQMARWIRHDPS